MGVPLVQVVVAAAVLLVIRGGDRIVAVDGCSTSAPVRVLLEDAAGPRADEP